MRRQEMDEVMLSKTSLEKLLWGLKYFFHYNGLSIKKAKKQRRQPHFIDYFPS